MPGGTVFLRFNPDQHGLALEGGSDGPAKNVELNHVAFEVAHLEEVLRARAHLHATGVQIDFEGRRRASSGKVRRPWKPPSPTWSRDRTRRCGRKADG